MIGPIEFDRYDWWIGGREPARRDACALCERPFQAGELVWGASNDCLDETDWGWCQLCAECLRMILHHGIPIGVETGRG